MSKIKVVDGRARLPGRPPTPTKLPNFYRGRRALAERAGPRKLMIALADPERIDRAGRRNPLMLTNTERTRRDTARQIRAEQESQIFRIRR